MIIVSGLPARAEKSRERIRQPQRAENIHSSFTPMCIRFGIEERNACWQSVIPPDLHDVRDLFGFLILVLPRGLTSFIGILFERHERQVLQAIVGLQIIEKTTEP